MKALQKIIQPLLIIAAIVAGVVAIKAFFMPVQATKESYRGEKIQQINYDYLVYTKPSILYPEGTRPLPPGDTGYPINIVDKIEFFVEGKLAAPASQKLEGEMAVTLLLSSEGQWQKELELKPEVQETAAINGKEFKAAFNLPFREALKLAEEIVREIGIGPNSAYKLIVQSTLNPVNGAASDEGLSASFAFELWQGMIKPSGEELLFSKSEEVVETVTVANLFSFFGYNINVITARIIFSVLFLFFLVLLLYQRQKNKEVIVKNPAAAEVRRIRKKYGNRIIEIADLKEIPAGYLQVQLHNFKDLLKLAEEREHPILHFNSVESQSSCFYTVDDNTVYVCRLNLS